MCRAILLFCFVIPFAKATEEVAPSYVYRVPPLLPSMAALAKEQSATLHPISLKATDGSRILIKNVRYVESRSEDNQIISVLKEFSFEEKQAINLSLKAALESGQISPKFSEHAGELFYGNKQLSLSFEVQGNFGQSSPVSNPKIWLGAFLTQFKAVAYGARLEDLSTINKKDVAFGFVIDGKTVEDKEESKAFSEKLKQVFAADEVSEEFELDSESKLLFKSERSTRALEVSVYFYSLDPATRNAETLTGDEHRELTHRWRRHIAEVLRRRIERREKLTPVPFEKLTGPKVIEVGPGEPIYSPELKDAKEYLAAIPQWTVLMDFFRAVSPPFYRRVQQEVDRTKLRFDPVDSYTSAELKVSSPHRMLDKEMVQYDSGIISIANNLYGKKNSTEKSYLVLYGMLLGIEGVSREGAFDFTCKIKMITHYEKKKEISVKEFESYVFQMMTNDEIEEAKSWKRKITLLRQSPGVSPQKASAAGTAVTDSFGQLDARLEAVLSGQQAGQFQKVFGELPQSTK